ncbi:hypothetical protein K9M16_02100 [Candidatus Babeliales bacterium]|nr:hypothetical protein [Candidatus Babeliales bacterium]
MKKIIFLKILLLATVLLSINNYSYPRIEHKIATIDDITEILELQENFNDDDKSKLVIFPKEIKANILKKNITANKIFVSIDTDANKIINTIKLFIIKTQEDFLEILEELGFRSDSINKSPEEFLKNYNYQINRENILNIIEQKNILLQTNELMGLLNNFSNNCLYCYYGGAYTNPNYRNIGLNFNLIKYALNQVCPDFLVHNSIFYMSLLFGQVEANKNNRGMVKAFTNFIIEHKNISYVNLQHLICQAFKPNFVFDETNSELKITSFCPGEGNIVFAKI